MQENKEKILAFEYVLKSLLFWQREQSGVQDNDLSILKALKLLFFVSACKAKENEGNLLVDEVFDKFVAMPYGHVESTIYNYIRDNDGDLTYYHIDNKRTTLKPNVDANQLEDIVDVDVTHEINNSISLLKAINSKLILMSAFELVDLSHAWYSWKLSYSQAQKNRQKSSPIHPQLIKTEDKIFSLQTF